MDKSVPIVPGETWLLKELNITQGLFFILLLAILFLMFNNIYLKFIEYALIIWYLAVWAIKTVREGKS